MEKLEYLRKFTILRNKFNIKLYLRVLYFI
jgi:hypothetical protein